MTTQALAGLSGLTVGRKATQSSVSAAPRGGLAALPRSVPRTIRTFRCQASEKSGMASFAESIGLPVDEGLFGFRPFPELFVGRLAMMGFLTSMVEEGITGRGTLQQIGLYTPDTTLLYVISGIALVATLGGLGATLNSARAGKLSLRELQRYRSFLGMRDEEATITAAQRSMKKAGDFTTPGDDMGAIAAARAQGSAADAFLSPDDAGQLTAAATALRVDGGVLDLQTSAAADEAAASMKAREEGRQGPSVSLSARDDIYETGSFTSSDWSYAKQVELSQGRWAMLGFLTAILVEASTGHGILGQLVDYLKFSGLLGAESGF